MTKIGMFATGVIVAVAGGALGLFMQHEGWIHPFPDRTVHPFQVPGDPPVTVGDGSFHAHSKNDWMADQNNHMTILPNTPSGNAGSFYQDSDCSFPDPADITKTVKATAFLWTDEDNIYDISPKSAALWEIKVTHANGHVVTISIVNNYLQFASDNNSAFDAAQNDDDRDRRHSPAGKVIAIDVKGANDNTGWPLGKVSKHHPHYTMGFCYR
jgi:hypothetical protein